MDMIKYSYTTEVQFMGDVNLVYVFLNNNFLNSGQQKNIGKYSYNTLPEYYIDTLKYNNTKASNTYFIMQDAEIDAHKNKLPDNVQLVSADELAATEEYKAVWDILYNNWNRYLNDPFWYNTFIRVILICIFQRKYSIENVVHIEADNLIFGDFTKLNIFESGEFGFSNECPYSSAPSFIYLKDRRSATNLLNMHIQMLDKGESTIQPYTGWLGAWITDMAFLDLIYRSGKNYKMLPCLPEGPFSQNFDKIGYVFDPTSYGMFLGGSNNGHPKGFIDGKHYIGQAIHNKLINVKFDSKPYIVYNNKEIPVFNLHVHNKKSIEGFLNG